jgi:hypothetical protein
MSAAVVTGQSALARLGLLLPACRVKGLTKSTVWPAIVNLSAAAFATSKASRITGRRSIMVDSMVRSCNCKCPGPG